MIRFSASEAALEGFRLTRERPGTIAAWSAIYAIGIFIIAMVMMASLDPSFIALAKKGQLMSQDPQVVADMLAHSWPQFLLVLVLTVFLLSVVMGGIYRLVLRPSEPGFVHLRVGPDELRLTLVNLLLFGIGMVCLFFTFVAIAVVEQGGSPLAGIAGALMAAVTIWVGVRLSLATPMTFAMRHMSMRKAWSLTAGKFWPLFGMIVLTVIFYIMVWVLVTMIGFGVMAAAGGEKSIANVAHLSPATGIAFAITLILQFLLQILQLVMIYGPFGVAYQQLHGDPPADPLRALPEHG